jgi:diaminopimelate epimerase
MLAGGRMTTITLAKLHATGNDFLVYTALDGGDALTRAGAAALCDRHTGVGADGVITLGPPYAGSDAHCSFALQNADGSDAEMSGNGMRCLAWAAARAGLGTADALLVDTPAGRRRVELARDAGGAVVAADVEMGVATFEPRAIPVDAPSPFDLSATFHGVDYRGDAVGMGNPHWVLLVDDVADARVTQHGPRLEHDARFPNRTNVEFARAVDDKTIELRVWERGVGETQSCGTGACATAAALHRRGLVGDELTVRVSGGDLRVRLGRAIHLAGPVAHVFDVTVDLARLGGDDE